MQTNLDKLAPAIYDYSHKQSIIAHHLINPLHEKFREPNITMGVGVANESVGESPVCFGFGFVAAF